MRAFPEVFTFALGALLLSGVLAFAQSQAPEAPLTPLPAPASDAGSPAEDLSDAAPITVGAPAPTAQVQPSAVPAPNPLPAATAKLAGCERAYIHNGFYLGVTTSIGGLGVWGDGPVSSASISGVAMGGSLAIGGSPVPGFAIAGFIGETSTGGDTFHGGPMVFVTTPTGVVQNQAMALKGNAHAILGLIGVLADWFPAPTGGWHLGGALGLGGASVTDDANNIIGGSSVVGSVFGGYQWWLGPSWSLGISGLVTMAPRLNMTDFNGNDTGYHMMPLSVGLQGLLLYY
jgi:hypothetical protein